MAEVKKENWFKRATGAVARYFRELRSELKKVVWPTPKALSHNVLISVGVMLASAVVVWGFDELAQMLVRALFTLAG